ncbi:MAG: SMI1/KNR4 family protein [Actinomycetales bacterium]|nr:SMI1/KNR4 family protein [Actinomycetales bacterium]
MTDGFDEVAARLEARGCDPDELAQVEADQGVRLPGSYRRMLRTMGRDMGGLFGGSDVAFPQVLGARAGAVELLEEHGLAHVLPPSAVVVMIHGGYAIWFLDTTEGEDPRVQAWSEEDLGAPKLAAPDLMTWIRAAEREQAGDPRAVRATRADRVPVAEREACPHCAGPMRWSTRTAWGPDTAPEHEGRVRQVAHCPACGVDRWRWADEPGAPLAVDIRRE